MEIAFLGGRPLGASHQAKLGLLEADWMGWGWWETMEDGEGW